MKVYLGRVEAALHCRVVAQVSTFLSGQVLDLVLVLYQAVVVARVALSLACPHFASRILYAAFDAFLFSPLSVSLN